MTIFVTERERRDNPINGGNNFNIQCYPGTYLRFEKFFTNVTSVCKLCLYNLSLYNLVPNSLITELFRHKLTTSW